MNGPKPSDRGDQVTGTEDVQQAPLSPAQFFDALDCPAFEDFDVVLDTVADEATPTMLPLGDEARRRLARSVLLFLVEDKAMRAVFLRAVKAYEEEADRG